MITFRNKKRLQLISLVTIVIPTHKRHHLLKCALEYYNNCGIKIIVGDSTSIPFEDSEKFQCEYYHLPDLAYAKKLQYLVSKVTTPYIVLCTDDDFTITNSILKCVAFLEKNQSFSAAQGETVFFKQKCLDDIVFNPHLHWVFDKDCYNTPDAIERICEGFQQTLTCFYAVRRTENLIKMSSLIEQYEIKEGYVYEFATYFTEYLNGYIKILPVLYQIRSYEPRAKNFPLPFQQYFHCEEGEKFKKLMFDQLSQFYGTKKVIVPEDISKIMNVLLNWANILNKNEKVRSLKKMQSLDFSAIPLFRPEKKMGLALKGNSRNDWQSFKKFYKKFMVKSPTFVNFHNWSPVESDCNNYRLWSSGNSEIQIYSRNNTIFTVSGELNMISLPRTVDLYLNQSQTPFYTLNTQSTFSISVPVKKNRTNTIRFVTTDPPIQPSIEDSRWLSFGIMNYAVVETPKEDFVNFHNWGPVESDCNNYWLWSSGNSEIQIYSRNNTIFTVSGELNMISLPRTVDLYLNQRQTPFCTLNTQSTFSISVPVKKNRTNTIRFVTTDPPIQPSIEDSRWLSFGIMNYAVVETPKAEIENDPKRLQKRPFLRSLKQLVQRITPRKSIRF